MRGRCVSCITGVIVLTLLLVLGPTGGLLPIAHGARSDLKKADVVFKINCSQIDPSKQEACKDYIRATRDQVYPILREMTGTNLSKCYKAVYYTILPADPKEGAAEWTLQNKIICNQKYSVDSKYRYDVHELIHTMGYCSGALDEGHVFHGALMNAVYSHLGVKERFYFYHREDIAEGLKGNLADLKKSGRSRSDLQGTCQGILANQMTLLYFDLGEPAIKRLYQSTIAPESSVQPGKSLTVVWGQSANKVQALLDTLHREYRYKFIVPACGY